MDTEQRAQLLIGQGPVLRPPIQALLEVVVAGVKMGATLQGAPDEIWAATAVNAAEGLGLDMDTPDGLRAACTIAELVVQLAGLPD